MENEVEQLMEENLESSVIHEAFKYRIYPTEEQKKVLLSWMRSLKFLWNLAQEQRLMAYGRSKDDRKYPTFFEQRSEGAELAKVDNFIAMLPADCRSNLLEELDLAWKKCWKGLSETPRFKRKTDKIGLKARSTGIFAVNQAECGNWKLKFPKMKDIPLVYHEPLKGKPTNCTISTVAGEWYAAIACELPTPVKVPFVYPESANKIIGLDLGVKKVVTDSNGNYISNPEIFKKFQDKKAKLQRKLKNKQKGSKNSLKIYEKLARLEHGKANVRKDFLHKLSTKIVNENDVVVMENLSIQNMTKSAKGTKESPGKNISQKSGLNRSVLDLGWGDFQRMLEYKLSWKPTQGKFVKVPAAFTSQKCSKCGHITQENRTSQADFKCVVCGFELNADHNAAINILNSGIEQLKDPSVVPVKKNKKSTGCKVRGKKKQKITILG